MSLAADEQVTKHVIGDAPDERDDLVVRCLVHYRVRSCFSNPVRAQPPTFTLIAGRLEKLMDSLEPVGFIIGSCRLEGHSGQMNGPNA